MPLFQKDINTSEEAGRLWDFLIDIDAGYEPTEEELRNLACIVEISLVAGSILTIPRSISLLSSLKSLFILSNKITDCSPLKKLINLEKLWLWDTKISDCSPLSNLANLKDLLLNGANIIDCSPLAKLTSLRELRVMETDITDCSPLAGLVALELLDLSHTNITDCSALAGLLNLKSLWLGGTKIKDCSPLAKLTNLVRLRLGNTMITDCGPLANLANLGHLDLCGLSLHSIPDTFQSLKLPFVDDMPFTSRGINLHDVRLRTQPVSIFLQPRELVDAYFRSPKVPINEAKVLFLGDGGVGKTHTIRRIMNDCKNEDYQPEVTEGIEINAFDGSREGRQFNVNFWDFGGQDIMHAMHRCFLTERSLYVVLLSNRDNLTPRARFWLKNIQSFAKHSPVLLAVNRWKNADSGALDMHGLRQEFPMLLPEPVYFYALDPSDVKFRTLLNRILDEAAVLDSTAMSFPESWAKIRQELLDLKKESHYIPLTKYYELCEKHGISDAAIQSWLLDWFNDMGVCFSYHGTAKEGFDLDDYKVLEPKWATNAVYTLIHNGKEYAENGNILLSNIRNVLEKPAKVELSDASVLPDVSYKDDAFLYILEVMRKFNLSYSVSPTYEFIPALCAENTPEKIHPTTYREKLSYIMKYNYLPDTVIHRLMIRCYRKLNLEMAWRKGMRLEEHLMDLIAVVDMGKDDATLRIDIYANGDTPHWKLLNKLRNTLLEINRDLSLEAEDSILYPIDGDESPIPVRNILITKDANYPQMQVFGNRGTMKFVSVDYLLGITFGENIVEAAEQTAMQEKQPFSQAIYNVTIQYGDVYSNNHLTVNNGASADQFLALIDKLVEHNCHIDDTLIQALISSLEKDGTPEAKAATEVVKQAKNERKNVLKALGDHMKSVTNIVNGAVAARKVIKYIPTLIDTVKPWAEENLPEIAEWIQNLFS